MTYKLKSKKLPEGYFRQREVKELKRKYKGHIPFTQVIREGHRVTSHYPKQTHKVGGIVLFNKKEYVVSGVSQKGVHLRRLLKSKKGLLEEKQKLGKERFVSEKKYSGKAVPIGTFLIFAPA